MSWHDQLMRAFYNPERGFVDGTTEFHGVCRDLLPQRGRILEVGSGPSNATSRFLATLGEVHGIDIDPDVKGNDALKTAEVLTGVRYPYDDGFFDVAVSNYVVEHVDDPTAHLTEIGRVLKPGGAYAFRTPNRYHYVAAFSGLTPHWVHLAMANRLRGLGRDAHDPYPTHYAMNTATAVERFASQTGFRVETLRMVEKEPSYGRFSPILFLTFAAYERAVNATETLSGLRSNLFVVLRKHI